MTNPPEKQAPKLLDQVRDRIRVKHYSLRTEEGHKELQTTMIYTYVLNRGGHGVVSPLDR